MSDPSEAIVNVNGETRTLRDETTVAELLVSLGHEPESVAVAVNGDFVPRAIRGKHVLRNGDQIACFKPIVGG